MLVFQTFCCKMVKVKQDINFLNTAFHLSCKLELNQLSFTLMEISQYLNIHEKYILVVYKLFYHKFLTTLRFDHDHALYQDLNFKLFLQHHLLKTSLVLCFSVDQISSLGRLLLLSINEYCLAKNAWKSLPFL